jgi:hypothetical protein
MKKREARQRVNVPARMRAGSEWIDVSILNMSSRGLMAKTEAQVKAGTYVEVRRGRLMIIARIVWVRGGSFGMRSQDRIDVAAVVQEPRLTSRPSAPSAASNTVERRSETRRAAAENIARRAERSRNFANAFQFIAIGGAGVAGCVTLVAVVAELLMGVSSTIQTALGGG